MTSKLTKITLIEDINKAHKLDTGKDINAEQFDKLYDMEIDELEFKLLMITIKNDILPLLNSLKTSTNE